jgi:hypothetical protein
MDELLFDDLDFPLGWCVGCAREVLTCAGDEAGVRHCVHCSADIAGPLRQMRGAELGERGYALHEEQGCGKADCGGGRCGTRS